MMPYGLVNSNAAIDASSHAMSEHAAACTARSSALGLMRMTLPDRARHSANLRIRSASFLTRLGSSSAMAMTNPASPINSGETSGTPCSPLPHAHIRKVPTRSPLPGRIGTRNGQACNPSPSHAAIGRIKITDAPPLALGVGRARFCPPELECGRPFQRQRGPLQPPSPVLFPNSSCRALPFEAFQRLSLQRVGASPISAAADYLPCREIHGNQLAQSLVSIPARSSVRPVSVQQQ